ncbi:MAG: hypothetical protein ACK5XL_21820, partial [Cyclobacteriaceae bacterium]
IALASGLTGIFIESFFSACISEPNLNNLQRTGAAALIGRLWRWEGSAAWQCVLMQRWEKQ